ncbi:hypothetical protein [Alkalihalobacillus pseudalcaliphilus]|uniref:hypothetical protein n=1 Tax=Alkalihalobacillus pseudalcaliphilus TaxID=79884 RepID=UPI00064DD8CB|nr:hypothetical protein [Alkalihalobacillus pseudalcaliphilus]KMK74742.1 hypothetical protein AB990_19855 [Alkalihalobacillus pseudalcaliphilus]
MIFQTYRMQQLLHHDPILRSTYHEIFAYINNEEQALRFLFEQYVIKEPIFQNAYLHLTHPS